MPEVVPQVGAEYPVQQIVEGLVPRTLMLGDVDTDGPLHIGSERERRFPALERSEPGPVDFPLAVDLGPGAHTLVLIPQRPAVGVAAMGMAR